LVSQKYTNNENFKEYYKKSEKDYEFQYKLTNVEKEKEHLCQELQEKGKMSINRQMSY
jgi:hypothetical protein